MHVVVIDDDEQHLKFIAKVLAEEKVRISPVSDPRAGLELIKKERPHLVLLDLMMPGMTGMTALEKVMEIDPAIEVVLLTGEYSTERAVEAIQKGAADYLTKPLELPKLQARIESLASELDRRQQRAALEHELLKNSQFAAMVGQSPAMLDVFHRIRRVAPHFRTVLITGPTGAGKELAASALHTLSPVASGPFVTCNCSAISESLAESELFGHVKGAFTGAVAEHAGVFEAANGGTVLLDEVGELSPTAQAKLLRVLQNREIQKVGSALPRKVDVRVIAATHRDLKAMVRNQKFREDLFYRLSTVEIEIPALSQRREDLPLLERHFIDRSAAQCNKHTQGITRRAQALLARYSWPGNIRELANVLESAVVMCEGEMIDVHDLPQYLRDQNFEPLEQDEGFPTLDEMERKHTRRALDLAGGNKVKAAEFLDISRARLYRILESSQNPESLSERQPLGEK